jgi:hypothetical protein
MGGYGSGRSGGRLTVQAALVLDVNELMTPIMRALREHDLTLPDIRSVTLKWGAWRWRRCGESEPWAEVEITLMLNSRCCEATLSYNIDRHGSSTGLQCQRVSIIPTPCHFGGVRWWWICPATGRPVRKLYLPNGGVRFLSRGHGGYNLAYASQRRDQIDQIHARIRRLYTRLKTYYPGLTDPCWPPKPKWMRWDTYETICDQLEAQANELDVEAAKIYRRRFRPRVQAITER